MDVRHGIRALHIRRHVGVAGEVKTHLHLHGAVYAGTERGSRNGTGIIRPGFYTEYLSEVGAVGQLPVELQCSTADGAAFRYGPAGLEPLIRPVVTPTHFHSQLRP